MKKYTHEFVDLYKGFIGFGWDRETDENSIICYLQMFSDDQLLKTLVRRMTDAEIEEIHNLITKILTTHLNDIEYHGLFLGEEHQHSDDDVD